MKAQIIIARMGGLQAAADHLGISYNAVEQWNRDGVSWCHFGRIIAGGYATFEELEGTRKCRA